MKQIKAKVCLIGPVGVGKSSLVRRYVKGIFSEKYLTTIGVKIDKKSQNINDSLVETILWDLEGEDSSSCNHSVFLRGAKALILIADGTRPETGEGLIEQHQMAKKITGNIPFIIGVNKCDVVNNWDGNIEVLENYCQNNKYEFDFKGKVASIFRTSAKTGIGMEELFTQLSQTLYTILGHD